MGRRECKEQREWLFATQASVGRPTCGRWPSGLSTNLFWGRVEGLDKTPSFKKERKKVLGFFFFNLNNMIERNV